MRNGDKELQYLKSMEAFFGLAQLLPKCRQSKIRKKRSNNEEVAGRTDLFVNNEGGGREADTVCLSLDWDKAGLLSKFSGKQ